MDIASRPNDPAALKGLIANLAAQHQAELSDKASYIAQLEEQVRLLKAILHLAKSERQAKPTAKEIQYSLFDEAEAVAGEQSEAIGSGEVAAHARQQSGRRPIPQEFPRVEVVHDIPDADKVCPCDCQLTRIGEEVSEKLDFIPATIQVIRNIRPKYACRACEGTEDDGPTVKTAPMPPQLIPQGLATPGLVAYVLASKFVDGLPFYRQERIFERLGLDISRATMCGWALQVARACQPLVGLFSEESRSGPIINLDETVVQVLGEVGRANTSQSICG